MVRAHVPWEKAGVPAGRDFYVMLEHVHPASPTTTDLLKNLTEKIGTHTLFYDQKKQKAKPQQTIGIHSAGSVPVPFGGLRRDSQMKQLQGVEEQASRMW